MYSSKPILLKARPRAANDWRIALERLASTLTVSIESSFTSILDGELYCYLGGSGPLEQVAAALETQAGAALDDPALTASLIQPLIHIDGPDRGTIPAFHYVVETNVDAVNEQGMNDWYNVEHLPGLASVPGCIAAARFRNLSHPPRYIACYDLVSPDTVERPEWLAVRNTEWSSRVRPHFRNTKRIMFRRLAGLNAVTD